MIVGDGDLASVLPDRDDLLFFASGVSNSQETRETEFRREVALLDRQNRNLRVVYFSSLAIFDKDTRYLRHKKSMEKTIKHYFKKWTIIRIGNITWGENPHTLINNLSNKLRSGENIEIKDEYRYIVDIEEFMYWIDRIPNWNCEMNIPGQRMTIREVFNEYVA